MLNDVFRLDGKTALVTGDGDLANAVSTRLARVGASVAVAGLDAEQATACADALTRHGFNAYATAFDVASIAETRRMVDEVVARFGRLDILVNSVGLHREEKAEEVTEDAFDDVVEANLKSAMFQAQAAARQMIKQGSSGKQVHLGSVRTSLALRGRGYAAYCASKGGLAVLCRQLAAEWAPHRINVNVIAPGAVRTVGAMPLDAHAQSTLMSRTLLGRLGEPDEIAHGVLFLASAASDFITGQVLYLDGGLSAAQ